MDRDWLDAKDNPFTEYNSDRQGLLAELATLLPGRELDLTTESAVEPTGADDKRLVLWVDGRRHLSLEPFFGHTSEFNNDFLDEVRWSTWRLTEEAEGLFKEASGLSTVQWVEKRTRDQVAVHGTGAGRRQTKLEIGPEDSTLDAGTWIAWPAVTIQGQDVVIFRKR